MKIRIKKKKVNEQEWNELNEKLEKLESAAHKGQAQDKLLQEQIDETNKYLLERISILTDMMLTH